MRFHMGAWHHEDELLCWINDTEYGLAAYIYTGRLQDAMRIGESIDAGMVGTCSWRSGFCDAVWSEVRWWQPHGPHRRPSRLRPRIAEPRPRCPRRSADPWPLGAATPGRRCLLNGAVAPLSPNDRTSCNQARPVADMTVPKLLQPKRVWPADRRNLRGASVSGAQPQPR